MRPLGAMSNSLGSQLDNKLITPSLSAGLLPKRMVISLTTGGAAPCNRLQRYQNKQKARNDRITGNALGDTVVLLCEKGGAA